MERRYAEHARQYSLEESIRQTEEMFRQAIAEQRGRKPKRPENRTRRRTKGTAAKSLPSL